VLRRWLAPGLLLVLPVTAALSASTGIVQAVEECGLEPGWQAPPGSRWLSRINRDHHRCWFLSSRAIGGPHTQQRRAAHVKNRDLASETDAVRRGEQRYSDLQTARFADQIQRRRNCFGHLLLGRPICQRRIEGSAVWIAHNRTYRARRFSASASVSNDCCQPAYYFIALVRWRPTWVWANGAVFPL
jgi:hypothetical protein